MPSLPASSLPALSLPALSLRIPAVALVAIIGASPWASTAIAAPPVEAASSVETARPVEAAPPAAAPNTAPTTQAPITGVPPARTLQLIRQWLQPGWYDNAWQTERDVANGMPDRLVHRPMHQFFAPVKVPQLEGWIVFQQASQDGSHSPDSLFRTGLLQFIVDEQLGVVRQRELAFKDPQRFRNAHLEPAALAKVTLDDVSWNPACDFLLQASAAGTEVRGPIPARTCWIESRGLGKRLWADDEVVIRPGEFWFLGRYRDDEGAVKWGNENAELNQLRRAKVAKTAR